MTHPLCTLVVVPRDRYSLAEASYESLCAENPASQYPVIYIDGLHPRPWAKRLDALAAEGKIKLIRAGFHLTQNEAYNLAIPHVRTKYILFMDNEILFRPGCVENLLRCAEETGASAVMPLIEERESDGNWRVHMCGGDCGVEEGDGQLWYTETHPLNKQALPQDLPRCQTSLLECHTFLVRTEMLQKTGPFDENIPTMLNHADFSLVLRAAGGTLWVETAAIIRFQLPPPLEPEDISFFASHWGNLHARISLRNFSTKWGVKIPLHTENWARDYRRRMHALLRRMIQRRFGTGIAGKIVYRLAWSLEPLFSWTVERWTAVPHRSQRVEALGAWRAPELDRVPIEALSVKIFRQPRLLRRDLQPVDDSAAAVVV